MTTRQSLKLGVITAAVMAALSPAAQAVDHVWIAGDYSLLVGPNPLPAGDRLLAQTPANKNFNGIAFINQGTVLWEASSRIGFISATVTNADLWEMLSDADLSYAGGNASSFVNDGSFRKSAGSGTTAVGTGVNFTNNGVLDAQTGTIDFAGGSTTFNAGTQFTGAGVNRVSGNASFVGAFSSANLVLAAGTFAGDSLTPAVMSGGVVWSGGRFGGTWQLAAGQTLAAQDGTNKDLSGAGFTNGGTVTWQSSGRVGFISSTVTNQSLWDMQADADLTYAGGNASSFVNDGTFRKSAGSGTTAVGTGVNFTNNGVLDAQTGTIDFAGGSTTFNAGTQFTGAGVNRVSHNASFVGAFTSANLVLAAGTFSGSNATPAVMNGSVVWSGGRFGGSWQLAAGQALTVHDGAQKDLVGAEFTNTGTVMWQSSGRVGFISSTVTNQNLWNMQSDADLSYAGGNASSFVNDGTFRKSAGAGTTTVGTGVNFINNGMVDAQTGTIDFAGGSATFNAGTQFTGAGVNRVSGNAGFVGAFSSVNLVLAAGTFSGDDITPAVMSGSVAWSGGRFGGTWQLAAGQALTVHDGAAKDLVGAEFTNTGTVAWQSSDRIGFISSTVVNQDLWDMQSDADLSSVGGNTSNFVNDGTFRKSAGAGTTTVGSGVNFTNNGVLDAQTGTIDFSGSSATFNPGTQFTGAGVNRVSGNASFVGGFHSDNLVLAGGTFSGSNATPAVMNGSVVWSGGRFGGTWQLASGQTLTVLDGAAKDLVGAELTNTGTVAWESDDRMGLISSTVVNQGLWDVQSDADLIHAGGNASSFVNDGTFRKSAGTGTTVVGTSVGFSNAGRIEALSGTLQLPANFGNSGTIAGTATVQTSTLFNSGHVAPGASVGTLTLVGNFVQDAGGFFDVDLNSMASSDLLLVTGTATLGGTLALHCFGACSLAVGDEVRILNAGGPLSDTFAGAPTLSGFATGAFDVIYDTPNGDVWLRVTETVTAVPEPGTWALMFVGLALTTLSAARRRHPT